MSLRNVLFNITTETIVIQKKTPGHDELSLIASAIVRIKMTTSMLMLHTIRVVKLPPICTKMFIQLKITLGTCAAKVKYWRKIDAYANSTLPMYASESLYLVKY